MAYKAFVRDNFLTIIMPVGTKQQREKAEAVLLSVSESLPRHSRRETLALFDIAALNLHKMSPCLDLTCPYGCNGSGANLDKNARCSICRNRKPHDDVKDCVAYLNRKNKVSPSECQRCKDGDTREHFHVRAMKTP